VKPVIVATMFFSNSSGLPACLCKASSIGFNPEPGKNGLYGEYWPWDREFYLEFKQGDTVDVFLLPRETPTVWKPLARQDVRELLAPGQGSKPAK